MQAKIRLVNKNEIDPEKWDNCVAKNDNGLIYAQFLYLNFLTKHWSAIIIGDYEAILPLPWNSKWGIKYYKAIPFIQQLGLIGQVDKNHIPRILQLIFKFASYGDLFFNYKNQAIATAVSTKKKTNLIVELSQDYNSIAKYYKKDLVQNIEKAKKHHPIYQENSVFSRTLEVYQEQYGNRFNWVTKSDFLHLTQLLSYYQTKKQCLIRELIDQTTEELLAAAILLKDEKRLYLLINTITDLGRKCSANHYLIDKIIDEFSNSKFIFDFEGSEIQGVRDFFKNFHPIDQPYFHFHHNQLSWPFKLFKS